VGVGITGVAAAPASGPVVDDDDGELPQADARTRRARVRTPGPYTRAS
jgi:hypothetical protein